MACLYIGFASKEGVIIEERDIITVTDVLFITASFGFSNSY
jgi:hypothetical protein